ncbi:hypothetical protein K7X08_017771 [Anisodus acutangulus]|uniref:PGG domain-containing protein n=1 Tax=Anisodus acutangulus TaxID=402998 RepID=A0A9Q1R8B5_9SOLA|nr:hypothetical protein K7X08_017771 [Anisodus acutangulus]
MYVPLCQAALGAGANKVQFVEELVKLMSPLELALQNKYDNTALCFAAASGLTRIAKVMHMPELGIERDQNEDTILHVLARKPLAFLAKLDLESGKDLFTHNRTSNMSSGLKGKNNTKAYLFITRVVRHLLKTLGVTKVLETKLMHLQALELVKRSWKEVLLLNDSQIGNLIRSPSRSLFVAVELGNFEFIVELIQSYPDLIWKLAPTNRLGIVSGAAPQMQRELLWFKEVEKNVQASYKEMRDSKGRTPRMLFTEEHKELVKEGEKWMKETASSCMLVAALITTVMFAAIFTVPGGNNNDTGTPIFLKEKTFILFSMMDALALFSSVISILMFLSILTSRYAEEDFLSTLPKRLIIGFISLFVAIAAMLVAVSSSLFIVLGHQMAWIVIPVAVLASITITLFAFLQFPLLADMIRSAYGSGIFTFTSKDKIY